MSPPASEPSPITVQYGEVLVTKSKDWVTVRDMKWDPASRPSEEVKAEVWARVQAFLDELYFTQRVSLQCGSGATFGLQPEGDFRHYEELRVELAFPPEPDLPDLETITPQPMTAKRFLRRA